ncbi:hypothetical protein Pmani_004301 [Petrolisthes manimaculis]|uniref:Uncharacterized protein n=1 Tax=Petrolisthes manimaculis TaxID=1843537 RepID=A0AAE1QH01_9EUCA|nr:hypothetical protein Pmani_004301 [Petrolisthes manimaculis]
MVPLERGRVEGESYRSLSCLFRISHNLISSIIPTVCMAIYQIRKILKIEGFIRVKCTSMHMLQWKTCIQLEEDTQNEAKQVRELLKGYFNNEGQVHWQAQMAQLH